jgi:hypothetical protein
MLIMGITPGAFLVRDHPLVFWGVIGSFYVDDVMLLILNLPLVGIFTRVAQIPARYLMPAVLLLCIMGAYGDNNNLFDVWVMLWAGVVGYLLRRYDFEPASLVLGLMLGPIMERSLPQVLTIERATSAGSGPRPFRPRFSFSRSWLPSSRWSPFYLFEFSPTSGGPSLNCSSVRPGRSPARTEVILRNHEAPAHPPGGLLFV